MTAYSRWRVRRLTIAIAAVVPPAAPTGQRCHAIVITPQNL